MFEIQRMENLEHQNCWVTIDYLDELDWLLKAECCYNNICNENPDENYRLVEVHEERMVWE